MEEQYELFPPVNSRQSRIVIAVETKIGLFGNRTDLIIVDEGTVRGTSLLECADPNVEYFNRYSEYPSSL